MEHDDPDVPKVAGCLRIIAIILIAEAVAAYFGIRHFFR